jgi:hypothetical protein
LAGGLGDPGQFTEAGQQFPDTVYVFRAGKLLRISVAAVEEYERGHPI